ncbi:MAG: PHP domain-containing protein [Oscillospiraceae bacterium]|jgi:histidinol-phosphatase (PHP family)|nr:PHP domain-containing protein [Oscillospiraceae bacterium]
MKLYDQHVHSLFSYDSSAVRLASVDAARLRGVAGLTFTEHYETLVPEQRAVFLPEDFARVGVELGSGQLAPLETYEYLQARPFDIVLGSIHFDPDGVDYYQYIPESRAAHIENMRRYFEFHLPLIEDGQFDIIAHLGYPLRYNNRFGLTMEQLRADEAAGETLQKVLKAIIKSGKGLELNCSGGFYPSLGILKEYKALGGELITLGSDSHVAGAGTDKLKQGAELLKEAGFTKYALYTERKPEWVTVN